MQERRAPRWLKWINPLNRFLLRRGIGPPPQHLLVTTGRRSGKPYATPVAVVEYEGGRYVVAGFAGSDWVRNARACGEARLQRGRIVEHVGLREVPPDQRAPILRHFATKVRGGQAFLTVSPSAPLAEFANAAIRHPIFRLVPMSDPTVTR